MEEKVTMRLKSLIDGETQFKLRWRKKQRLLKKGILNLTYKQGLLFEKYKQPDKFTENKTCKNIKKVFKARSGNEF